MLAMNQSVATLVSAPMLLLLLSSVEFVLPLDNGAALTPPLGWQNWNGFMMNFNSSLFRKMAKGMQANGLLDAGYNVISVGGSTYPRQGLAPKYNSSNSSNMQYVIVRNASGYYQIDPGKFPGPGSSADCLDDTVLNACLANHSNGHDWPNGGPEYCGCRNGNEGMRALSAELRAMGYKWGSYIGIEGETCQVDDCNIPSLNASKYNGFFDQDFDLIINAWQSDYVMIDSVGQQPPDANWSEYGWPKEMLSKWGQKLLNTSRPVILHSCHNGCGSTFVGPTLRVASCNVSDLSQFWEVPGDGHSAGAQNGFGYLRDAGAGLCVGCGLDPHHGGPQCGNDALSFTNGSGYGNGMQACGHDLGPGNAWNYGCVYN